MVNKGQETEITTLKCREKATKVRKRSEELFWLGQKNFWKKVQKSEKTAFLTSQKKWKPSLAAMHMKKHPTMDIRPIGTHMGTTEFASLNFHFS